MTRRLGSVVLTLSRMTNHKSLTGVARWLGAFLSALSAVLCLVAFPARADESYTVLLERPAKVGQ